MTRNIETDYILDNAYYFNKVEVIPFHDSLTMNFWIADSTKTNSVKKYNRGKEVSPIDSLNHYIEKFGNVWMSDSILFINFDSIESINERMYTLTIHHDTLNGVEYFMHKRIE